MAKRYYKTNCELVLNAIHEMNKNKDDFVSKINKVADHFDAKAGTMTSMTGIRFGGLVLNNYHTHLFTGERQESRKDRILWTVPNTNNISHPRSSLTKKHFQSAIKGMEESEAKLFMKTKRNELKLLREEYINMTKGIESVSFDEFFASIGTNWGDLMFGGLNWFEFDGFVYMASGIDLSSNAVEIFGSEFDEASTKNANK